MIKKNNITADVLDLVNLRKSVILNLNNQLPKGYFEDLVLERNTVIGVKLNLKIEFLRSLRLFADAQRSLENVVNNINKRGHTVSDVLAAYPNLDEPKFVLPFGDNYSHKFLIRDLLIPRRYSLKYITRIKLQVYSLLLGRTKDTSVLHPYCFLIIN